MSSGCQKSFLFMKGEGKMFRCFAFFWVRYDASRIFKIKCFVHIDWRGFAGCWKERHNDAVRASRGRQIWCCCDDMFLSEFFFVIPLKIVFEVGWESSKKCFVVPSSRREFNIENARDDKHREEFQYFIAARNQQLHVRKSFSSLHLIAWLPGDF